jgi:hypothetical protein
MRAHLTRPTTALLVTAVAAVTALGAQFAEVASPAGTERVRVVADNTPWPSPSPAPVAPAKSL